MQSKLKFIIHFICLILQLSCSSQQQIDLAPGKWVLLNFWASWCDNCLEEVQSLNQLKNDLTDKIEIYGINFDDLDTKQVAEFKEKWGMQYPMMSKQTALSLKLPAVSVLPTTFLVTPEGKLLPPIFGRKSVLQIRDIIANYDV